MSIELPPNQLGIANVALNPAVEDLDMNGFSIINQGGSGGNQNLSQVLAQGNSAGSNSINMNNNKITALATPTVASDAATKAYVDANTPSGGPFLPLAGGAMTGDINMNGRSLGNAVQVQTANLDSGTAAAILLSSNIDAQSNSIDFITSLSGAGGPGGSNALIVNSALNLGNRNIIEVASLGATNIFGPNSNPVACLTGLDVQNQAIDGIGSLNSLNPIIVKNVFNMNNNKITALATPTVATDAATKAYVDSASGAFLPLAGGTMTGNINLNGSDIQNVNDMTMTGLAATISNTGGTLNISAIGTTINSLGSCAINSGNALGFSSSIEKFQMKNNTMSSFADGDLTFNDVDSISNTNSNNVDLKGGVSNTNLVLNSSSAIALNPASTTVPVQIFNLPNTSTLPTGFGLAYNPTTGRVTYSSSATSPATLPFTLSESLDITSSAYSITATDANKAYFINSSNNTPACTFTFPQSTSDPGLQNVYMTFFFGANITATFTNAAGFGVIVNSFKQGDCCTVQYLSSTGGSPPVAFASPVYQSIVRFAPPATPTLSDVLQAGNTTGLQDIVMGDGTPLGKANITNMGVADIVTLQVNAIEPILPLISSDIGVVGNLVFDPMVGSGLVRNVTGIESLNNLPISIPEGNNLRVTSGEDDIFEASTAGINMYAALNMNQNAIENCPTFDTKVDKTDAIQSNSYYVNDGINDIQAVINEIGSQSGKVIYMSAGSYGGDAVQITEANNIMIMGPGTGGNPSTICELAGGRDLSLIAPSRQIRISNLQVEGATFIGSRGNNYFQSVQMLGNVTFAPSSSFDRAYFFYDCEFSGTITVPVQFLGSIVFIRCNFTGASKAFINPSPLQIQFSQCINIPWIPSSQTETYSGENQFVNSNVGIVQTLQSIVPSNEISFSTQKCATLGSSLLVAGDQLTLRNQLNGGISTVTLPTSIGPEGPAGIQGIPGIQGVPGIQGEQGAPGQSTSFFTYKAFTNSQAPPPGSGEVRWNNLIQSSATELFVSHLEVGPIDVDIFLALLAVGDTIIIQDKANSNNYQKWNVTGTPVNTPNSFFTYPVTLVESTHSFSNNDAILVALSTVGPAGPQGPVGPEGPGGPAGPQGPIGLKGDKGDTGDQGLKGDTGDKGDQGLKGDKGDQGLKGDTGDKGDKGDTGDKGEQGVPGQDGQVQDIIAGTNITVVQSPVGTYTISASGSGGSQNLSDVLTVGNDAGGQSIINVGSITANQFNGVVSGNINTNSITTASTADLVISRVGSTAKVSSLMPLQFDGNGATDKQIRNVTDVLGTINTALNVSSRGTGILNLQGSSSTALSVFPSGNVSIGNYVTDPGTKLYVDGNIELTAGNTVTATTFSGNALTATNLNGHTARKLPYYNGGNILSFADSSSDGFICSTDGNDVEFVNPNTLVVSGATNVQKNAGIIYNSATNISESLAAGTDGQVVTWSSNVPVNTPQSALLVGAATNVQKAQGLIYNSSENTTVAITNGTSGQVLTSQGTLLAPIYTTLSIPLPTLFYPITSFTPATFTPALGVRDVFLTTNTFNLPIGQGTISFRPASTNAVATQTFTLNVTMSTSSTFASGNKFPQSGAAFTGQINQSTSFTPSRYTVAYSLHEPLTNVYIRVQWSQSGSWTGGVTTPLDIVLIHTPAIAG